jgi:hypothetical protein
LALSLSRSSREKLTEVVTEESKRLCAKIKRKEEGSKAAPKCTFLLSFPLLLLLCVCMIDQKHVKRQKLGNEKKKVKFGASSYGYKGTVAKKGGERRQGWKGKTTE